MLINRNETGSALVLNKVVPKTEMRILDILGNQSLHGAKNEMTVPAIADFLGKNVLSAASIYSLLNRSLTRELVKRSKRDLIISQQKITRVFWSVTEEVRLAYQEEKEAKITN